MRVEESGVKMCPLPTHAHASIQIIAKLRFSDSWDAFRTDFRKASAETLLHSV